MSLEVSYVAGSRSLLVLRLVCYRPLALRGAVDDKTRGCSHTSHATATLALVPCCQNGA